MERVGGNIMYFIIILGAILLAFFLVWENNKLEITRIEIEDKQLPENFKKFRIVHLSDLHNKSFGDQQSRLIKKVESLKPDMIVFTGDLVDEMNYNEEAGLELLRKAKKIAPVYFAAGNNDLWSGHWRELKEQISNLGVELLIEKSIKLTRGKESIVIAGINDLLSVPNGEEYPEQVIINKLEKALFNIQEDKYKILLVHRPQYLNLYNQFGLNLVLAGHTHGGQIRLPFIGGFIAPGQWFFPRYTAGLYKKGKNKLVINRGLGNSVIPQRLFNRPEIGLIILNKE